MCQSPAPERELIREISLRQTRTASWQCRVTKLPPCSRRPRNWTIRSTACTHSSRNSNPSRRLWPNSAASDPMRSALLFAAAALLAASAPKGVRPLFNGKDISGWHVSEVNHHGNTKAWTVHEGVLMVTQDKPGNGGILLTDRKYRDFEISLEVKPDYGCDGGLFLRSDEQGNAYQVMLDYLPGGNIGGIYGEGLPELNKPGVGTGERVNRDWEKFWKKDDWNLVRARME